MVCLSKQQKEVMNVVREKKQAKLGDFRGIYTDNKRLQMCLKRLQSLGLVKMIDYGTWEYSGMKK